MRHTQMESIVAEHNNRTQEENVFYSLIDIVLVAVEKLRYVLKKTFDRFQANNHE